MEEAKNVSPVRARRSREGPLILCPSPIDWQDHLRDQVMQFNEVSSSQTCQRARVSLGEWTREQHALLQLGSSPFCVVTTLLRMLSHPRGLNGTSTLRSASPRFGAWSSTSGVSSRRITHDDPVKTSSAVSELASLATIHSRRAAMRPTSFSSHAIAAHERNPTARQWPTP